MLKDSIIDDAMDKPDCKDPTSKHNLVILQEWLEILGHPYQRFPWLFVQREE